MSNITQINIPKNSCDKNFEDLTINLPILPIVKLGGNEVEWYNRPFDCTPCGQFGINVCCSTINPACIKCNYQNRIPGGFKCPLNVYNGSNNTCINQITEDNAKINNPCYATMPQLKELSCRVARSELTKQAENPKTVFEYKFTDVSKEIVYNFCTQCGVENCCLGLLTEAVCTPEWYGKNILSVGCNKYKIAYCAK